jgi:hypothetical protein
MPSLRQLCQRTPTRIKRLRNIEEQFYCDDAIYIQSLNERQKAEYEALVTYDRRGTPSIKALLKTRPELIARCLCDEHGTSILTRDEIKDLCEADGRFTTALYLECTTHIGDNADKLITVDAIKNSEAAPDGNNSPPCDTPPNQE